MAHIKFKGKRKKDFSTRRQVDKIISSVPDIEMEAIKFTKLNGGGL